MNNGAILNPSESVLMVSARVSDISVIREDREGWVTIVINQLTDGIEIISDRDDLWWPV